MSTSPESARVMIVSANREEVNMVTWPLGAAQVATAAEAAGHEVILLDLMGHDNPTAALESALNDFKPDVTGVSVRNIDDQRMRENRFFLEDVKEVIKVIRRNSGAPIVLGGAGYSICPASALKYLDADMGIAGEGESAFTRLVGSIASRNPALPSAIYLPGRAPDGPVETIRDLDDAPLPDSSFIPSPTTGSPEFWMPVQSRRGCSLDCHYCATPSIEGRTMRARSPRSVVHWIAGCRDRGISRFFFVDNTFNLPVPYARELTSCIHEARLDITWRAIVYPWKPDERLVDEMAASGCVEVSLGTESGSPLILRGMNKRFTPADVSRWAVATKRSGMRRTGFLLLGGPGETLDTARESLEFADSLDLDALKITLGIRIYPGTGLERRAREDGMLAPGDDLLFPAFYMVPGLEGPLLELIREAQKGRRNWLL